MSLGWLEEVYAALGYIWLTYTMANVIGWGSLIVATQKLQRTATSFQHEANLVALDKLLEKGYLDTVAVELGGHWVSASMSLPATFPHASFKEELDVMLHYLRKKKGLDVVLEFKKEEQSIEVKIDGQVWCSVTAKAQ